MSSCWIFLLDITVWFEDFSAAQGKNTRPGGGSRYKQALFWDPLTCLLWGKGFNSKIRISGDGKVLKGVKGGKNNQKLSRYRYQSPKMNVIIMCQKNVLIKSPKAWGPAPRGEEVQRESMGWRRSLSNMGWSVQVTEHKGQQQLTVYSPGRFRQSQRICEACRL